LHKKREDDYKTTEMKKDLTKKLLREMVDLKAQLNIKINDVKDKTEMDMSDTFEKIDDLETLLKEDRVGKIDKEIAKIGTKVANQKNANC